MKRYYIEPETTAICSAELCSDVLRELWQGFTYTKSFVTLLPAADTAFVIGAACPVEIPEGKQYAVYVGEDGIAVSAHTDGDLMQGIFALMRRIKCDSPEAAAPYLETGVFFDTEDISVRMAHFCIFPETTFDFMQKMIRLCGALHYTHIILEFWGMLQYDCMKELGWPMAFTKEQAKELVSLIRLLGMEPVPMFNHLGHASGVRMISGKHVVLDQNPALAPYFGEDGWNWNIQSETVLQLLKNIRAELYEVFGDCEYFHLGVDECYLYGTDYALADSLTAFLCRITGEVLAEGRRPIIWGDMFISHETLGTTKAEYSCNCHDQRIADKVLSALDKRTIIADWQYHKKEGTLVTTPYFMERGFDVLCCPWERCENVKVNIDTVRKHNALGVMETTWHTLSKGGAFLFDCAELCKPENRDVIFKGVFASPAAATLLRKVWPRFDGYETAGWATCQIELGNH